ncbi:hypothetical protein GGE67_005883 [Rhizobium leucaenae]|uniref:Uncharacterized protein n=1 Tax=Rhizobium leucaenae TaxID=29450 RepID=A0A7W7EMU9_9HYPH|nr:hypothetical protein [Rhizobium leucaenae]MBB6305217.1 hypothetical protein [Rhizobium leucaenae]
MIDERIVAATRRLIDFPQADALEELLGRANWLSPERRISLYTPLSKLRFESFASFTARRNGQRLCPAAKFLASDADPYVL